MNILLVGAGGFIGRHLLRALLASGHTLFATSRSGTGPWLPGVRWLALDLAELADDPAHFPWPGQIDLVINAAGLLSTDAGQLTAVQNHGTCELFELAALHGARVLQVSALGAGTQPNIPFLASKAAADEHLLRLDVYAVVLRPSLVIGEGGASSAWLSRLSPWPVIPLLDTQVCVQPLHVDDLVAAVLALLRDWPARPCVLPLVGRQPLCLGELIDHLRAAQGWGRAFYVRVPSLLAIPAARLGDRLGWRGLNSQTLHLARRDTLASPEPLFEACGFRAAPLESRLVGWPRRVESVQAALRPLLFVALAFIWLWTALVCLGPGYGWGLRIMAELGVTGWPAALAVIGGALTDAALGIGMLLRRWRRIVLRAQLVLMLGYMLVISLWLPHYWFDPFGSVTKNLVLLVGTLWLLWSEPPSRR